MTTDPTMRIVWYEGRPHAVSSSPQGREAGRYWYVLVDQEWQRLFACTREDPSVDGWTRVEQRVLEWLARRTST